MPQRTLMLLLICFGIVGACFAQDPSTRQFVYTVSVPKTAKHPALIQTGFRLAGTKGIVTSLHGVADGSSFSAFNENGDALRNLTIEMVDIARDLALLRSDELITRPADGLNSCHSSIVSGQSLHALGHPVGIDLWNKPVTAGNPPQRLLSGLIPPPLAKDFGDRRSPADDRDVIGLDGNLVPGDSGAPLLTDTNETCGVVDGGLLGGAAGISWAIPLGSVNWRQSTNAMQDIQRIAALDIANLFAFEEDTEAASGQFVVAPGEQGKYQSISDAVSHAPAGGTVLVRKGTYSEAGDIKIDKQILLLGDGKPEDVTINIGVDLEESGATLKGLTVVRGVVVTGNATIENCSVTDDVFPMLVDGTLYVNNTSSGTIPTKVTIRDSSISSPKSLPVGVGFQDTTAIEIKGSASVQIESSKLYGAKFPIVTVDDKSNVVIDSSTLTGTGSGVVTSMFSYAAVKNSDLRGLTGHLFSSADPSGSGGITLDQNNQK